MKKILILIAIIVFPFLTFAKEIKVDDINFKIDISDDYIVLTRDNLDNNSDLKKLGISGNYMKNTMEQKNIYLDILSKDISYEILVVVPDIKLTFYNLSDATDSMLDDLKEELVKRTGAEKADIYKGKHNYVVIDYYDKNTEYYIVNYYTIVNAKGYNIQLQKKFVINDDEKEEFKKIVDNIYIDAVSNTNNKSGLSIKNIIIGAIIGAVIGLISYSASIYIKKKNITVAKEENKKVNKKTKKKTNKKKKVLNVDDVVDNKKSS